MTLRVWRARIESVVFGKDGGRQVTAMYATSQEAARLAGDLEGFAGRQSVFIAPRAGEDRHRIDALQATESLLAGGAALRQGALEGAGSTHEALRVADAHRGAQAGDTGGGMGVNAGGPRFCAVCGTKAVPGAKFCGACGTALPTN
jgi:hypothetical protein